MPWLTQLDPNEHVTKNWELGHAPLVFGRGDDTQIKIDDNEMSRRHFRVKFLNDIRVIHDLNSANGTTHAHLKTGDRVAAERSRFVYQVGTSTLMGFVEHTAGQSFKDELKDIYTGAQKKP